MKMHLLYILTPLVVAQLVAEEPSITIKNIAGSSHHIVLKLDSGEKLDIDLAGGQETKVPTQVVIGDPKKKSSSFVRKISAVNKESGQKRSYELKKNEKKQGLTVTVGEKTEEIYVPAPFASEFGGVASAEKKTAMVPDIRVS
jgi:hypothetical protein